MIPFVPTKDTFCLRLLRESDGRLTMSRSHQTPPVFMLRRKPRLNRGGSVVAYPQTKVLHNGVEQNTLESTNKNSLSTEFSCLKGVHQRRKCTEILPYSSRLTMAGVFIWGFAFKPASRPSRCWSSAYTRLAVCRMKSHQSKGTKIPSSTSH